VIKKQTHIIQLVTSLLIISLVWGCNGNKSTAEVTCSEQCLSMENQQLKILFNTKYIMVEQQYKLTITSKQPIESMYIKGTNMNMGTLPLIYTLLDNDNGNFIYQSSFMLGLCSEPEMQWQLTVETEKTTSSFDFISYWKRPKDQ